MTFIETLKSVGGVKPCPSCAGGYIPHLNRKEELCSNCHGKSYTLDLAPLLAKPRLLKELIGELLYTEIDGESLLKKWYTPDTRDDLYIVGPQRASNLVYEVARQIGGTAVVSIPIYDDGDVVDGYRLSIHISPDATVLFVTDRLGEQELTDVMCATMKTAPKDKPHKFMKEVLMLVSRIGFWQFPNPERTSWKIISLHQERTWRS
jgi:hypothetical protein